MTLREFEAFDSNPNEKWELVEGVPHMAPSALGPHNHLVGVVFTYLNATLPPQEGWYVLLDTSLRFGGQQSEVRPDVAVYRQSDLKDPDSVPFRATPRLIVECLSPSNAHYDLHVKLRLYEKVGVPEYWVVDPKTGAISLFVHRKAGYEQLAVDPAGFIASPLLKRSLRIVVKPWTFEVLGA